MGVIADNAAQVFRDFVIDGMPTSGIHQPTKADIRSLFEDVEDGDFAGTFLALTDAPDTYAGSGSKYVKVKSDASGVEFGDLPALVATFLDLTDTPANYTGAALKVVRVNSGGTALEFATPSASVLDLVADSGALSATGSVVFTLDFSTYGEFTLDFDHCKPTTDNTSLILEVSTNSGSSWITTPAAADVRNAGISPTTTAANSNFGTAATMTLAAGVSNSNGLIGQMHILGSGAAAHATKFMWQTYYFLSGATSITVQVGGGSSAVTSAVNAIRLTYATTSFATGRIRLWGRRK